MLTSPGVRRPLSLLLTLLPLLAACHSKTAAEAAGAWSRLDLWGTASTVESTPPQWQEAVFPRISYLGSAEVRDMRQVPPQQLVAFPTRSAGQVKALEQRASSRVRWTLHPGKDAYFSFVPLGTANGCACTYRVGIREGRPEDGRLTELHKVAARPMGPFAPAAVELDLAPYAGRQIDLLLQVDGSADHPPDRPVPSVLWGSPAVYDRSEAPEIRRGGAPNILLIGVDTLRADALGAWGRKPSLTPSLDRLAAESDVWPEAYTAFNVTNPSFASIFTGLYGKNHGVYDLKTPLPPSQTTLAELLAGAGYRTLALISASHLGDHNSGLGQGFAEVQTATEQAAGEMPVDATMDWLAATTRKGRSPRPFFVWLHLFDPHTPHTPPEPYALGQRPAAAMGLSPVRLWTPFRTVGPRPFVEQVLAGNRDLYDGEVAYADRQVGRLLDFLASRGLLENTVVALVADHGENLGEHGILFRHIGLFETTTHVPLMIRWPGAERRGRRLPGLVQTIDLFPSLLAAAGLQPPPSDGQDLRKLTGEGQPGRRAVFTEHSDRLGVSVRTRAYRYGWNEGENLPKALTSRPLSLST